MTTASTEAVSAIPKLDRSQLTEKLDLPQIEEIKVEEEKVAAVEESKEANGQAVGAGAAAANTEHDIDNGKATPADKVLQEKEGGSAPKEDMLKVASQ